MRKLINKVITTLTKKKMRLSVAESCTGGMLSNSITSLNGASKIFKFGIITYSNESKIKFLKVPKKIITKYGAVSFQCCLYMVKNLGKISKSNISVSITGVAGPKGGSKLKPVGLVFIGIKKGNKIKINRYVFMKKSRNSIQREAVKKIFRNNFKFC